jgi:hypothetical protein
VSSSHAFACPIHGWQDMGAPACCRDAKLYGEYAASIPVQPPMSIEHDSACVVCEDTFNSDNKHVHLCRPHFNVLHYGLKREAEQIAEVGLAADEMRDNLATALLDWSTLARDAAEDAASPDHVRRMRAVVVLRAMASAMMFTAESVGRDEGETK